VSNGLASLHLSHEVSYVCQNCGFKWTALNVEEEPLAQALAAALIAFRNPMSPDPDRLCESHREWGQI
jgi:hypothetical protein